MSEQKQKRPYRKITPRVVAEHQAAEILAGNATEAVTIVEADREGNRNAIASRAARIVQKRASGSVSEYIENQLEQIGSEAIERVAELVQSSDERIATKNSHFVIEHIRGKAVQRSVSLTGKLNIQSVLD